MRSSSRSSGGSEYAAEHLPGAIHIPLRKLDDEAPKQLDLARAVLVYCFDYR